VIRYHASWVLPIGGPPIRDGWVAVDGERVVAFGRDEPVAGTRSRTGERVDLGNVAVLPGLVNAHTHFELSHLRHEVAASPAFVTWIRSVIEARRRHSDPNAPEILAAVRRAIGEAVACGTAVVGDVSNTLVTFEALVESCLAAVVFYELIRFTAPDPAAFVECARAEIANLAPTRRVRASLAAHAPYSVAPLVFRAMRATLDRDGLAPSSVHLSESAEENEFISTGTGPWRTLLEELGAWDPSWVPPGGTPVQFLDETGFLGEHVLAVHGVQMTSADLDRLKASGATLVTCPRSNVHTGAGAPPLETFYASGIRVAIGTDSLASVPDLNVFAELAAMRALAPRVPAAALLESATRQGARALGFDAEYGSIEPGKIARLIAVSLPRGLDDVEEYLVSGIEAGDIRWIGEAQ
jgi:cytosine/adenosine deaminase-related metal-dependent hydrolase